MKLRSVLSTWNGGEQSEVEWFLRYLFRKEEFWAGQWETVKRIETLGTGFFMRSHVKTPYAWVGVFSGENRDVVQVIDKRTLEIVKTIRPEPGKTATHVEFTRDGRYIFVSVWDIDGALVIYDAATLEEIKRIPMHKPSGKY